MHNRLFGIALTAMGCIASYPCTSLFAQEQNAASSANVAETTNAESTAPAASAEETAKSETATVEKSSDSAVNSADSTEVAAKEATSADENPTATAASYVDYALLGAAFQSLDASLMTDVALQLRHAEKEDGKSFAPVTSAELLEVCQRVAKNANDSVTLERLARVAEADGDKAKAEELKQLASIAGGSRDMRGEPMFSASDVDQGTLANFANVILQIRAAKVAGDSDAVESLKQYIATAPAFSDAHRKRLLGVIDSSEGFDPVKPEVLGFLRGASRGGSGEYAAVIVDADDASTGQTVASLACSGMRYLITPSGAIVQSYGRLGAIQFEPGDIIMMMGGLPVNTNNSVDAAVNAGYLNGQRLVVVRDRNTGNVFKLYY